MTEDETARLHTEIDNEWSIDGNRSISRRFKFRDFAEPFALATRVALLAEQEGHHPNLEIGWGYLSIKLTTHVAKGLTENDFIMAAKIDDITEPRLTGFSSQTEKRK